MYYLKVRRVNSISSCSSSCNISGSSRFWINNDSPIAKIMPYHSGLEMQKTGINSFFFVLKHLYSLLTQFEDRVKFDGESESGLKIRVWIGFRG